MLNTFIFNFIALPILSKNHAMVMIADDLG